MMKSIYQHVQNAPLFISHITPSSTDNLRERGHPFSLPDFSTSSHKKSFVVRTLYKFI